MASPGKNAGAGGFTLFVDAIDEARAAGARAERKERVGRPKRRLLDIELKTMKTLETLRRRVDKAVASKPADWVPDEDTVKAATDLANAITRVSRSLRLSQDAEAKQRGNLTTDELDQVFRTELKRNAPLFSEEEWRALLSVGMGEDIAEAAIAIWSQRKAARTGPSDGNASQ